MLHRSQGKKSDAMQKMEDAITAYRGAVKCTFAFTKLAENFNDENDDSIGTTYNLYVLENK